MDNCSVVFENTGTLDVRGITVFGISAKGDNKSPIGQFGTGLKYAIAVLLREKQDITIYSGYTRHTFEIYSDTMRDKSFQFIRMTSVNTQTNILENITDLPFTTHLGYNWELWMAFRELYSNVLDEKGSVYPIAEDTALSGEENKTYIVVTGDAFMDVLMQSSDIFLDTTAIKQFKTLEAHEGESNAIFYQGIKVMENTQPTLFRYNLTSHVRLTEDRTLSSLEDFRGPLVTEVTRTDDEAFIAKVVSAPNEYYESTLSYNYIYSVGDTFLKVMKKLIRKGKDRLNPSAVSLYENTVKRQRESRKVKATTYRLDIKLSETTTTRDWEVLQEDLNDLMLAFESRTGSESNLRKIDADDFGY